MTIAGTHKGRQVELVDAHTVKLKPRKRQGVNAKGEELEGTIQKAIIVALLEMPGVQVWRQNTGKIEDRFGRPVSYGLCTGSSDVLGIVTCSARWRDKGAPVIEREEGGMVGVFSVSRPIAIGRFFALEVKKPGNEPTDDQRTFLELVRRYGGAAHWADNVADAVAFVRRVQNCEDL